MFTTIKKFIKNQLNGIIILTHNIISSFKIYQTMSKCLYKIINEDSKIKTKESN